MKPNCPADREREAVVHVLEGGYCPHCADFDERQFRESWHPLYFLVSGFIQRHNWRGYHAMDGDPVLAMVMSEIWLHNVGRKLARELDIDARVLSNGTASRRAMPKCNAYSLSQALRVPPQTVRRKVNDLMERGWVERTERGELRVTSAGEVAFHPAFDVETMRDFVSTARAVFASMGLSLTPGGDTATPSAGHCAKPAKQPGLGNRTSRSRPVAG